MVNFRPIFDRPFYTLNIPYVMYKMPIKNECKIIHLLKSIISNVLSEYVVSLMKYKIFWAGSRASRASAAAKPGATCRATGTPRGIGRAI